MKNFTFFIALVFSSFGAVGQNVLTYNFNGTLAEASGQGPELTILGSQGVFMEDTLLEIGSNEKWVYRFDQNCGLQFDNAGFIQESYTIEVYFVFDNLSSWKRVIDWKNRKSDGGAYVYYGKLNFYPFVVSEEAPVLPGEYTYYVVTRDAATKKVILYADGENEVSFIDNNNDAVVDQDNVLNFFFDDLIVGNEASAGAVAMLRLYDYALDSNAVKQNFENLGSNVFAVRDMEKQEVETSVYPNPASAFTMIDLKTFSGEKNIHLVVQNMLGQTVLEKTFNSLHTPAITLDVSRFQRGVYLVRLCAENKISAARLIVR